MAGSSGPLAKAGPPVPAPLCLLLVKEQK